MAYATALGALYSHPGIDPRGAIRVINDRFTLAKGYIPYYNVLARNARAEAENGARLLRILNKNVTREMIEAEDRRHAEKAERTGRGHAEWATSSSN